MTPSLRSLRTPAVVTAGAVAGAAGLLATVGGELASAALRVTAFLALLAAAAAALRWRRAPGVGPAPSLAIQDRRPLGKDSGVAVVAIARRRILVGYGSAGVRRIADLGPTGPEELR